MITKLGSSPPEGSLRIVERPAKEKKEAAFNRI